jgi:hypothetical protein
VSVKNAVFWDVAPCGSYKNRRFEGKCRRHHQGRIYMYASEENYLDGEQPPPGATSQKTELFRIISVFRNHSMAATGSRNRTDKHAKNR